MMRSAFVDLMMVAGAVRALPSEREMPTASIRLNTCWPRRRSRWYLEDLGLLPCLPADAVTCSLLYDALPQVADRWDGV